jgi:hypothetical protein
MWSSTAITAAVAMILVTGLVCIQTEARVPVQCRLPDIHADVAPGTTRQFVEYCPEEAWPRGVGNTLIYFPVIYWFAVFTGRDLSVTDLSSVGSVCRIFHCGFPFTSEMKKKFPDLQLDKSPRKVNYNLLQYFSGNKHIKNDVININGYSATLFPNLMATVGNYSECVRNLTGCSRKDYVCMEHFAFRQHFPGGFRSASMLPESVVGLPDSSRRALVLSAAPAPPTPPLPSALPPTPKTFHAAIHIRAQLKSLENKDYSQIVSTEDINLYNNTIFPLFSKYLTKRFYEQQADTPGNFSATSPPRVFVSVDDITLKRLLVLHLRDYRDPRLPVQLTYVNNSQPIKCSIHLRDKGDVGRKHFPVDAEYVPTMFDWFGVSQAEFVLAYR